VSERGAEDEQETSEKRVRDEQEPGKTKREARGAPWAG
jgi:hypothetical protein